MHLEGCSGRWQEGQAGEDRQREDERQGRQGADSGETTDAAEAPHIYRSRAFHGVEEAIWPATGCEAGEIHAAVVQSLAQGVRPCCLDTVELPYILPEVRA